MVFLIGNDGCSTLLSMVSPSWCGGSQLGVLWYPGCHWALSGADFSLLAFRRLRLEKSHKYKASLGYKQKVSNGTMTAIKLGPKKTFVLSNVPKCIYISHLSNHRNETKGKHSFLFPITLSCVYPRPNA